ncbi:MAG: Fic family protein, partial [Moraxellaceae bacterium]|nr:Fic family protein [Moraxellaceae bacterium]
SQQIAGYKVTSGNFNGLYITQLPTLNAQFNHIEQLNNRLNELKQAIPKNSDLWQVILQKMRSDWTYHSNAIEGSTLTQGDTLFFLQEGLTVEGKPFKDFLDAQNHAEAIDILFSVVNNNREISEGLIKEINALLLNGIKYTPAQTPTGQPTQKALNAGEYKKLPNHVIKQDNTIHQYVTPEQVSVQMAELVAYINQGQAQNINPILLASVAHYNMVRIHPFDDGNGRGARILMNLILMKAGYFPAIIKREHKRKYLLALAQADKGNITPFTEFVSNQLAQTLQAVIDDLQQLTLPNLPF